MNIAVRVSNAFLVSTGRGNGAVTVCLSALVRSCAVTMIISVVEDVGMAIL